MPAQPKISVLVPIFNVEKYLRECLDSVANQTLKDIEIICIDDGSTDSSPQIIKEYADKDPRFIVITKKNSGYGDSMNKGLAKASGEYIGIVESDDFIDHDMFENLYNLGKKDDAEVVKSEFYYYFTHLDKKSPQWDGENGGVYSQELRKYITKHNTKSNIIHKGEVGQVIDTTEQQHILYQKPAIWSAIYSNSFLKKHGIKFLPSPGASYQDTAFSFKVWSTAKRVVFTDKAYLHYRQDNEASSVNSPGKVFCVADEYAEIEKFLKKHKLWGKFAALVQKTKYGAYSWNFKRLAEGLDSEFLDLFSKQYKAVYESSVLDPFYFDTNERRDLREIIYNPEMFLARKRAKKATKVSVIVPVYNVEKYLAKCLDSLVGQTMKEIEIICVNDGSPDDSISILEEYHAKDPRITIRETANRGPAAARNHGMAQASGDYLMFCDSDDRYSLDACEKMYNTITKKNVDVAVAGIDIDYSTTELARRYKPSDTEYYRLRNNGLHKITKDLIQSTDVSPCNKIYSTSLQRKYEVWFPNGLWYEDSTFFMNYMLASKKAYFLRDQKTYIYVRRDGSIMATTARKTPKALDHVKATVQTFWFMKRHNLLADNVDLFIETFAHSYRLSVRHMPHSDYPKLYEFVRRFISNNKSYLNSIDPEIITKLSKLPPKRSFAEKVNAKIRPKVSKYVNKVMVKVSPAYRKQSHVMKMVDDLHLKAKRSDEHIEKLEKTVDMLLKQLDK
jgi:glycosyltransferase involved in cell wall biosynthesis